MTHALSASSFFAILSTVFLKFFPLAWIGFLMDLWMVCTVAKEPGTAPCPTEAERQLESYDVPRRK